MTNLVQMRLTSRGWIINRTESATLGLRFRPRRRHLASWNAVQDGRPWCGNDLTATFDQGTPNGTVHVLGLFGFFRLGGSYPLHFLAGFNAITIAPHLYKHFICRYSDQPSPELAKFSTSKVSYYDCCICYIVSIVLE
jgi:hypothetical protein